MEALQAIGRIRVVRRYADRAIKQDVLSAIVDAGRHAGSSKNLQRWDFIVVTDRATIERLEVVGRYSGHVPSAAAVIALVVPAADSPAASHSIAWDLGRAAQNIVLAAWALGVGSCPVTVYDEPLARASLGYPADHRCPYLVTLGYPADPADLTRAPRPGGRKALQSVLHEGRW